ncbi:MAG: hypothetical protein ACI4UJ_06800 [Candidatus Cryptobacteroides sp.]
MRLAKLEYSNRQLLINMRRITAYILTALAALTSCVKEEWKQDLCDEARAILDRVVGIYVVEEMGWDGNPVDLNGDGTAEPNIADELTDRARATVDRYYYDNWDKNYDGVMKLLLNVNEFPQKQAWSRWSLKSATLRFMVKFREFEPELSDLNEQRSTDSYRLENFDIQLLDGERFVLSADTMVYDYLTQGAVNGRMSWTFKCISGKGRNTGK